MHRNRRWMAGSASKWGWDFLIWETLSIRIHHGCCLFNLWSGKPSIFSLERSKGGSKEERRNLLTFCSWAFEKPWQLWVWVMLREGHELTFSFVYYHSIHLINIIPLNTSRLLVTQSETLSTWIIITVFASSLLINFLDIVLKMTFLDTYSFAWVSLLDLFQKNMAMRMSPSTHRLFLPSGFACIVVGYQLYNRNKGG